MPEPFRYTHRVTYSECTLGNHVYYARYLDILEAARAEFMRSLGTSFLALQEQDTILPVIECRLRYKAQAHYDDTLKIEVHVTEASGARLTFTYRILDQRGTLILQAETLHVCTTTANKPKRLPPALASLNPQKALS